MQCSDYYADFFAFYTKAVKLQLFVPKFVYTFMPEFLWTNSRNYDIICRIRIDRDDLTALNNTILELGTSVYKNDYVGNSMNSCGESIRKRSAFADLQPALCGVPFGTIWTSLYLNS